MVCLGLINVAVAVTWYLAIRFQILSHATLAPAVVFARRLSAAGLGDHTQQPLPSPGHAGDARARPPDSRAVHGRAGLRDDRSPGENTGDVSGGIRRPRGLVAAHPARSRLCWRLEGSCVRALTAEFEQAVWYENSDKYLRRVAEKCAFRSKFMQLWRRVT